MNGDYDCAIKDCKYAIDLDSNNFGAYYNRGAAYEQKGDLDHAIVDFSKAIELNPDYVDAYFNRGRTYGQRGDYDRAIKDFDRVIELDPQNSRAPRSSRQGAEKTGQIE